MFLQLLVLNNVDEYDFLDKSSAAIVALSNIAISKSEYDCDLEESEDVLTEGLLN